MHRSPPFIGYVIIVQPMHDEYGQGGCGIWGAPWWRIGSWPTADTGGHWGSRCKHVCAFGGKPVGHHATVRKSDHVDPVPVYRQAYTRIVNGCRQIPDVVNPVIGGFPATVTGIPVLEVAKNTYSLRIKHDKMLSIRQTAEAGYFFNTFRRVKCAVNNDHQWHLGRAIVS